MKRQALSLISLLSLLLMAGSAIAQTIHVRSNVPFNFSVGNKSFPAGAYDIGTISSDSRVLLLQARDSKSSMMVGSNAAEASKSADRTKLVFNRYRDQYFLAEIWTEGATRGHHLPKTSREKELAKELAQDLTQRRVEIVASLY
jgi:hypothetical protein